MGMYRRRLPHVFETDLPVFLTWSLHGSVPQNRNFTARNVTSVAAFLSMDRLLEHTRTGPRYLAIPEIADVVVESLHYHSLSRFHLHAFVVMSNHVHSVITPVVPIPTITRTLKSYTAKRANELLFRRGPFWAEETFDRTLGTAEEFRRACAYTENNPVRAGLASAPQEYRWSSAWKGGASFTSR